MKNFNLKDQVILCINKELDKRMDTANHHLLENIKKDTEPLVPYNSGDLSESATIDYATNTLRYSADYVDAVYNSSNLNFNKKYHPQAQDHWLQASIALNKSKWLRTYKSDLLK